VIFTNWITALSFLQCFYAVSWEWQIAHPACVSYFLDSLLEQLVEEDQRGKPPRFARKMAVKSPCVCVCVTVMYKMLLDTCRNF